MPTSRVGVIMVFRYAPDSVVSWLYRIDSSIQFFLHLRQTDLVTNYFVFFIFALALTLCTWGFLRLSSDTRLTREIVLLPVAGFSALAVLPATAVNPWNNAGNLRNTVFSLEILFVLYLAFRFLNGKWPRS